MRLKFTQTLLNYCTTKQRLHISTTNSSSTTTALSTFAVSKNHIHIRNFCSHKNINNNHCTTNNRTLFGMALPAEQQQTSNSTSSSSTTTTSSSSSNSAGTAKAEQKLPVADGGSEKLNKCFPLELLMPKRQTQQVSTQKNQKTR
jgi:hypothetical protein